MNLFILNQLSLRKMINTRIANKSDIDGIVNIEFQWRDVYPCWGRDGFLREFDKKNSYTFIAEMDSNLCGFINFWLFEDFIEINSIVVAKEFLRKNVGSTLIDSVLEFAYENGVKRIILEVNENNTSAIELYKKKGFCVYNKRKKYYDFKYDALMMEKIL